MACKSCRVLNNALLRMQDKYDKQQADLRKTVEEMRAVTDIGKHGAGVTASQMWADKIDKLLEEGE